MIFAFFLTSQILFLVSKSISWLSTQTHKNNAKKAACYFRSISRYLISSAVNSGSLFLAFGLSVLISRSVAFGLFRFFVLAETGICLFPLGEASSLVFPFGEASSLVGPAFADPGFSPFLVFVSGSSFAPFFAGDWGLSGDFSTWALPPFDLFVLCSLIVNSSFAFEVLVRGLASRVAFHWFTFYQLC